MDWSFLVFSLLFSKYFITCPLGCFVRTALCPSANFFVTLVTELQNSMVGCLLFDMPSLALRHSASYRSFETEIIFQ